MKINQASLAAKKFKTPRQLCLKISRPQNAHSCSGNETARPKREGFDCFECKLPTTCKLCRNNLLYSVDHSPASQESQTVEGMSDKTL